MMLSRIGAVAVAMCLAATARAQTPHILGTWTLNPAASQIPGPPPWSQVRRYAQTDNGFLVGLAVTVDAQGNPSFLQFSARPDGKEYPEHGVGSLAQYRMSGAGTPQTYSERRVDEYTVAWTDRNDDQVAASGTRRVSEDGRTMTLRVDATDEQCRETSYTLVFDRVSEP